MLQKLIIEETRETYMRRYRHSAAVTLATLLSAAATAALAQDAAAKPAMTKLDELLDSAGLSVSGYVAASYYASNGYPANIHQFDIEHNTFQLDEAGLQVAYHPKEGFGALVDVIAGEDAKILHQAEANNATASTQFDVRQAFVQYATGNLTVMAGKFVTLAGAEVINPTLNTNFSRSLLFFDSEPLTHTGVRAAYALGEFTLTGGVNNGWNTTSTSYGSKTGEAGIAWAPASKLFAASVNAYFGKSQAFDAEKTLIDVVATYNVTSQLSVVLNFDWDQQDDGLIDNGGRLHDASWNATALYVNYAINAQFRVSLRGEYLDDTDGFVTGASQTLKEGTLTLGYAPLENFELRAEFRYDKSGSDTPSFYRTRQSVALATPDSDNLSQFALQAVYKFSAPPPAPSP
ncbi:MAG: porin [Proteobacteria bacterium]|nr:porin [Pseudomonadota bacterium]